MKSCVLALVLLTGCYSAASLDGGRDDDDAVVDDDDAVADDDDAVADDDDAVADDDDAVADDDDAVADDDDAVADDDDAVVDDDDAVADDDDAVADDDDAVADDDDAVADDDDAVLPVDLDGDGYFDTTDCDDTNPQIHPGSTAQVDGVDSDCDGLKDWLVDIWISADDAFEYCIDDEIAVLGSGQNWPTGFYFQEWLTTGTHTIGIQGWDLGQVITAAIAHIEISNGMQWVSDATWRYDPNPTAGPDDRSGWCGPFFNDSAWDLVNVIGPIGTSPWGNAPSIFPAGSPASWIWDYFPVNLNTQYLRKNIVLP